MTTELLTKIAKARTGIILDQPFFGSLVMRMGIVLDPTVKAMRTNGRVIRFNPEFVDQCDIDQLKGGLCHEIMHPALQHHLRRDSREEKKWNRATDYAINQVLNDAGIPMPKGSLFNPAYAGLSAEQIYPLLEDQPGDSPGAGDAGGAGADDPGQWGAVDDAEGDGQDGEGNGQAPSAAEQAQQSADWKVALAQAAQQAKAMGKLPASIARLVEQEMQPRVDWREVLRRFIQAAAKNDYTWRRPNRRHIARGLYLPSLHSETMGSIVVGVDTSGSIDAETLSQFAAEVRAILEDLQPEAVTVIYCDAAVNHVDRFEPGDLLHMEPHGGGGTAFEPVFRHVEGMDTPPVALVYLTDMFGSFPQKEPPYPTLWASIGGQDAPFGEVVRVR